MRNYSEDYQKQINKITDRLWEDVCQTIDKCIKRGLFEKEELDPGEFWYRVPEDVYISIPHSNDLGKVEYFIPEGDFWTKTEKAPAGGVLYTDHNYAEEITTSSLHNEGLIDLYEILSELLGDPVHSDYHTLIV